MQKRLFATLLATIILCTSINIDAFAVSDAYNADNYIVDKNEAYGGNYLVITNTARSGEAQTTGTLPVVNSSMLSNVVQNNITDEEAELFEEYSDSDDVSGFDQAGRALLDPASVLPEFIGELSEESAGDGSISWSVSNTEAADYKVNDTKTLYLMNERDQGIHATPCICVSVGQYCTVWIPTDDDYYEEEPTGMFAAMDIVAAEFDEKYPKMLAMFGDKDATDNSPYGDGDKKTALICYDIFGDYASNTSGGYVGGYFYAADLGYSNGTGNDMDCIHIDSYQGMRRGTTDSIATEYISNCFSTLVHELQHMINYSYMIKKDMETIGTPTYLNETFSLAAEHLMYEIQDDRIDYYNYSPTFRNGLSFLNWGYNGDDLMDYAVGYLFSQYIRTQYKDMGNGDGSTIYKDSMEELSTSNYDLLAIIADKIGVSKEEIFLNFRAALELKNPTGPYGFAGETDFTNYIDSHIYTPSSTTTSYSLAPGGSIVVPKTGEFTPSGAGSNIRFLGLDMVNKESAIDVILTGENEISEPQGQLELTASVAPSYLSQNVTYSISSGAEYATLEGNVLTAVADGTVVIKVAWAEKEAVYNEYEFLISHQQKMPLTVTETPVTGGKRITCSAQGPDNVIIYYTLDGSDPTTDSDVMPEEGIFFDQEGVYTLKAYAHVCEESVYSDSEIITTTVEVEEAVMPEIVYETQEDGSLIVTIMDSNGETSAVYYTMDGTDPTIQEELRYTQPISIKESGTYTIKAISVCEGLAASEVNTSIKEVAIEVSEIILSEENVTLYTNVDGKQSIQLTASIKPDLLAGQGVEWSSSSDVVTVTEDGTVTAVKNGTAIVYAQKDGVSAACNVEVKTAVERMEITNSSYSINRDQGKLQINTQVYPTGAGLTDVEYIVERSDREGDEQGIAVIDENGMITAVRNGVVKITVRTKTAQFLAAEEQVAYVTISNQQNYADTYKPRISTSNITLNKKMIQPVEVQLLPLGDTEVINAVVNSEKYASYVEVANVEGTNQWQIILTEEGKNNLRNGTHWIPIMVSAQVHYRDNVNSYEYNDEFAYTIRVKVTNKAPAISVNRVTINPYYALNEYALSVKSNQGKVTILGLEDNESISGFVDNFELSEDKTRLIRRKEVADFTKFLGRPVVSGYLRVQVEGYAEQLVRISATISSQKPYITPDIKNKVLNYGKLLQNNVISFGLVQNANRTGEEAVTGINTLVWDETDSDYGKWSDLVSVTVENDIISFAFDTEQLKVGTYKFPMLLTTDELHNVPVDIQLSVQRQTTQPKLILSSTKLQLNAKYPDETAVTTVASISQANVKLTDIIVTPAEKTVFANVDDAVRLAYDADEQCLVASIEGQNVGGDTYKFICQPQYEGLESDQVITVTVNVYEKDASVKVIKSGQINVLERDSSYVRCMVFPCDFTGEITEVALWEPEKTNGYIYDGSELFTLDFDEKNNSVEIRAKEDSIFIKGKSYAFRLQVTNEHDVEVLSEDIVIKLYQPSVRFSVSRTPVFYRYVSAANNTQDVDLFSNRGGIATVSAYENENGNLPDAFSVVFEEDASGNHLLQSVVFDGVQGGQIEPGTYRYTFAVILDGQLYEENANGQPYAKPYTCRVRCIVH